MVDAGVFSVCLRTAGSWLRVEGDDWKWLSLVVGVALVVRVAWVLATVPMPDWDAAEYDGLAWRLASGEGYVAPDGTPTAFRPVGYPAFLAAIYLVFGHSWTAGYIANAILSTVTVILTYRLAREFLCGRLSLVAAGIMSVFPSHVSYTAFMGTESLHAVFVMATLIGTIRLARRPNWRNAVLLGLIIGLSVYVRSILLLFPIVIMLLIWIQGGGKYRTLIGLTCVLTLAMLLAMLPWTVRNHVVMGEPVLTSTNGSLIFYIGNGPGATGIHRSVPADTFSDSSEITMYREAYRLALEYMAEHPVEWIKILPRKFFHLWASDWSGVAYTTLARGYPADLVTFPMLVTQVFWVVVALVAAAAAFTRPVRDYWLSFPTVVMPLTLLYWTAFHMVFQGEGRYHMQIIPLIVIVAVHVLGRSRDWRSWMIPSVGRKIDRQTPTSRI